ncbi:hypothetical protein CR159_19460 [Pollutimonas subterranea]|uniref:YetF C-terminal domain-containing protein n=1 Tax=Pollutimonas subterranea TaxID=2045210 RepID=A0A2N4TZI5_9BURK|nr:YetF domain-containing protein [Pollutimonas subterranea]PLC48176.1 hypothetical protein CR159_19460 [Pollutimonas subterranea]
MDVEWSSLFELTIPPLEIIVRGSLVYWFIFLLLRMAGRRDLGSIGISSILLLVLMADAAQNAMAAEYKSVGEGMILIATLVFWSVLVDRISYFIPASRPLLAPDRICLIKDGVMQKRGMRKEHVTEDELMSELRLKGIDDIAKVRRAYIEEAGDISVLAYREKS